MSTIDPANPLKSVEQLLQAIEWQANRLRITEEDLANRGVFDRKPFQLSREEWADVATMAASENAQRSLE